MTEFQAPNWTADWLNAWLAAIGATVLVDGLRLHWSDDPVPCACFTYPDEVDIPDLIEQSLPTLDEIDRLVIARNHPEARKELPRNVDAAAYAERAALARRLGDWSLAATVTDLGSPDGKPRHDDLAHSPFDPPVSKGLTIWQRLHSTVKLPKGNDSVRCSARGELPRAAINGLGFDFRRIPTPSDPNRAVFIDPVIETLAFAGMLFLPIRGRGRVSAARGWQGPPGRVASLRWPAWREPRSASAIDAFLDRWWGGDGGCPGFESVPYAPLGSSDTTRGYGSRPIVR